MLKLTAVLFAAGALLLSPSFASAQTNTVELSRMALLLGAGGETAADDLAKEVDSEDVLGDWPAMTLAVNGRIVATHAEHAAASANGWNWTLLLLGCAGLVVTRVARRPARRAIIST